MPEEIEEQVKELAEVSMGTDVNEEDMSNIMQLAEQVIEITQYRAQLFEYLKVIILIISKSRKLNMYGKNWQVDD